MRNFIEDYLDVTPDPRSVKTYLMGSPLQIVLLLTIYVCFVKKWGPLLMQNRKPFELKAVLIVYNIFQILINGYLVYAGIPLGLYHIEYDGGCIKVSEKDSEIEKLYMRLSYLYCMVKVLDLCDTIFFILRKRYKQVTFLHFYHHLLMSSAACLVFRYIPNGHFSMIALVNSFVHTVMYFYYLFSSYKPNLKESIWWKKYITIMQMTQFVFLSLFLLHPWLKDPRVKEWFLIGSLKQTYVIVALYAFFIKKLGPSLMKKRPPFELKLLIRAYNIFQIFINGYMTIMATPVAFIHYKWTGRCFSVDESVPGKKDLILWLSYLYCLVKILDFLDTIFFVLRKRYKQVSFLHFYHHVIMGILAPGVFQYTPNGHLCVMGYVNSIVHTVMYFYYFLSNLRPDMKKSIWWKKYITLLQLLQFVFLTSFLLYPLVNGEHCGYPFKLLYVALMQNFLFFILFSRFFIKTYLTKAKLKDN